MTIITIPDILNLKKKSISELYQPLISLLMPKAHNGLFTRSFMEKIEQAHGLINIQLTFFLSSIWWIGVLLHFDLGWV